MSNRRSSSTPRAACARTCDHSTSTLHARLRNSDACLLLGTLHQQVLPVLRLTFLALRDHLLLIQVHPLGFLILEHLFI
jgi:hypothetical protein